MIIIETPIFTKQICELINDEHYAEFQRQLCQNPESGDIISGTGGLRKIRCSVEGRGKRGGIRIIYYWYTQGDLIYMLLAYPKNQQADLTQQQKQILKKLVEQEFKDRG